MLVLALDVGTSSARARVYDERGRARPGAAGHVSYEPRTTPDGGVELDADSLLDAVARAIDECLVGSGAAASDIVGVGASVFWHSLLGLDRSGRALTPLFTWADTRSAAAARALRRELDAGTVLQRTGAPIHSTFFPAKLRWLRETQPEVFGRVARWCGFAELLQSRLTGAMQCSLSMASGTGLLDQERGGWDGVMLEAAGIQADTLPSIDDEARPGLIAPWADRWPALARVPWYPAHGDGACSNLGSGCAGPGRIALNVGTSAALRVVLSEGLGEHRPTPSGLWRYRVDGRRALVGGATSEGGNVLAWCRKTLALPADDAALEQALAAVPPDGHGLTALPFFAGERSPGWRPEARAALAELSLATDAVEIARALLEAVAFRLAEIYDRLHPLAAADHQLIGSGGAIGHSAAWSQIIADAIGVPIGVSPDTEASSRGAAILTLEAQGVQAPPPADPVRILRPDPANHDRYRTARRRQLRLYDKIVGYQDS